MGCGPRRAGTVVAWPGHSRSCAGSVGTARRPTEVSTSPWSTKITAAPSPARENGFWKGVGQPPVRGGRRLDPDVWGSADTFDVHRRAGRHVAFGYGIHQCVGQNLARAEMDIALTALLRRIPTPPRGTHIRYGPEAAKREGGGCGLASPLADMRGARLRRWRRSQHLGNRPTRLQHHREVDMAHLLGTRAGRIKSPERSFSSSRETGVEKVIPRRARPSKGAGAGVSVPSPTPL
ncbi:cytochrome P450 [Streptomyces sp. NPDC015680]|uniref:cytochrome P450 n=1 Tax=Streptomyces sp. NPDC015680 TaxID=3364962 RepID=UPI0036FE2F8A